MPSKLGRTAACPRYLTRTFATLTQRVNLLGLITLVVDFVTDICVQICITLRDYSATGATVVQIALESYISWMSDRV